MQPVLRVQPVVCAVCSSCSNCLRTLPLGLRDYWSKFRYNFIFYVDEIHLKGRGLVRQREGGLAEPLFPALTDAR